MTDTKIAAKSYGALFFLQNFLYFLLYGVVRFHNMWYNGAVFQPEVLCVKLNYDRKSKDPTYFIQQGIRLVTVQLPGLLDSWFLIIMQLLCYMVGDCFDWDRDAVPLPVSGQHSIQAIMCSLIAS